MLNPEDLQKQYPTVKATTIKSICLYVNHGLSTGDFLRAVLSNNLQHSLFWADKENRSSLFEIVRLCHYEIPSPCWGSPEKVKAWLEKQPTKESEIK